jgi:chemosensory pili system protein ChpA (sensor histidine kinase/response regulator)
MVNAASIQTFLEEAESRLPVIRGGILICVQNGGASNELETSLWQIQTIKGAAITVGLIELAAEAEQLENAIRRVVEKNQILTDKDSFQLLDCLVRIEALLLETHFRSDDFSLDINSFIEESFDNLQLNQMAKRQRIALDAPSEEFSLDDLIFAKETATLNENLETSAEEFEIDEEMLEIFAEEAEDLLRSIASNLEILEKQPTNREALMEIRRNAHTFKGSAGIIGLKKPSELAHRVEDLLDFMADHEISGNRRIFEILLASTDCLSALTSGENSEQLTKKVTRIYKDFDELMRALAAPAPQKKHSATPAAKPETDFENVYGDDSVQKIPTQNQKSVVRVSLEKLDDLMKIVRDLVVSRSVFEQRLGELDFQLEELQRSTRRLQRSTARLETEFEADMLSVRASNSGLKIQDSGFKTRNLEDRNARQTETLNPESEILNTFDTLEFDRYTEFHQATRELVETTSDAAAINCAFDGLRGNLETLFDTQRRLIEEMQDKLLRIRMVNFGTLAPRLLRTVRVTCEEENKHADLSVEGENLEIDTQILDSLIEPLLHLLRNAVAHGIESPETRRLLGKPEKGLITVKATNEGTHVVLTISDDGRGISVTSLKEKAVSHNFVSAGDALAMSEKTAAKLIFLPGLTTADKLSQTAGRGVGMNIIKTAVERQQGTISVSSQQQKGTTFTVRLPVALAVVRALIVEAAEQTFAFPLGFVRQISEIPGEHLERVVRDETIRFGDTEYALFHLNEILGFPAPTVLDKENTRVLLLEIGDKPRALIVERIVKPEEIVIKPLCILLQNRADLLGAAILGDGRIAPVVDLFYLLKNQKPDSKSKTQSNKPEIQKPKSKIRAALIVDDSPSVRHLTSNIVKNAGFEALIAKDGLAALEILQTAKKLPDVILTDVEMPRMDGYELLSTLKRNAAFYSIPVVMITSRAGEKHRSKAFDLGVSEYLAKPFDDARLIEVINRLM